MSEVDRFARSRELFARAQESIAGGVNSGIRKLEQPVPLYFSHGHGARVWDVDGNEYVDFQLGQGALFYGHAPAGQAEAIAEQATRGIHWAAQSELEIDVAEKIRRMMPAIERVRFGNSGTEAVLSALRLARATTGKPLVVKFEGHYHGWSDEGLVGFGAPADRWGDDESPASTHPSAGVIPEVLEKFVVARWNDPEHLRRRVIARAGQIAAIIFEPCLCNTSCIEPVAKMIETIRELCDAEGAMMIADETITGCRFSGGGAQGYYGFKPDLTILAKAIGGGVPVSVLGGTERAMAKIITGEVVHAGTLNANPLCLASCRWCLDELAHQHAPHPLKIKRLGSMLMRSILGMANDAGIPLRPQGPGLVFHTTMLKPGAAEGAIRDHRDYVHRNDAPRWAHLRRCLLEAGVRAIERGLWFISLAHDEHDIEEAIRRIEPAFARHASEWRAA